MRPAMLITVAVSLATVAACGGGSDNSAASSSTSAAPTTTTHSTSHRPSHTSSTHHTTAHAAASFKADLTVQGEGSALLTLTNTGAQSVTVQGWPTLKFLGANNAPVAVPEQKVQQPGAGPSITLASGRTAFAGVKWVTGDKADPATFVATTVEVSAPGHGNAVKANLIGADGRSGGYVELPLKSVQVGTLQPSSQGVLF